MRLVIFGASGRTGRLLVERALAEGHEVKAFVREPSRLPVSHERLAVIRGDVLDAERVDGAVAETDAVISVLGPTKASPKDMMTRGIQNIVAAMQKHGVRRLVSLTGAGVRDARDEPKFVDKVFEFLLRRLQPEVLADAEGHVEIIRRSGLDWIIVRGPRLTEGPERGEYRVGLIGKNSGTRISRSDVADFLLRQVDDRTYLDQMPVISY